jgi:hypothetical protein
VSFAALALTRSTLGTKTGADTSAAGYPFHVDRTMNPWRLLNDII